MSKNNEVIFKPGDIVIQAKTQSTALYIVKEGQLEVYKTNKDGNRIPIGLISSGQYIGETALLLNRPHSSNVVALTEVKAIKIEKDAFEAQLKNTPPWFLALTKGLVERLHQMNDILRRNDLVDDKLATKVTALEEHSKALKKTS